MTEELSYIMQFLTADGYVIRSSQDLFVFTNKFYKEFTNQDIGVIPISEVGIVKTATTVIAVPTKAEDVKEAYLKFIGACNIPKRMQTSTGEVYNLNQYSEKGAKAFKKILFRTKGLEINMDIVIKATQLYYKSPGYKLKVGNFIGDGTWETHYQEMLDSIESQTLTKHISNALDNDTTGTSRYRLPATRGIDKPSKISHPART